MKKNSKIANKTIIVSVLSVTALLGCSIPNITRASDNANIKFWSADTINKVVKDRGYDYYKNIATDPALSYRMAKGEFESAQIIMTPDNDVSEYDVSISEIKDAKGNIINKDNIEIYAQKYIYVEGVYDAATYEKPGYFPDALLKLEASKKYKENKLEKDQNQAVYVSIQTDIDQTPGNYSGTITFKINGRDYDFPINVEVLDVEVSEITHSKSVFINHWNYQNQELNSTQSMLDKYTEACAKYRLGTDRVVVDHNNSDQNLDYTVEKIYHYMQDSRIPTVSIPYKSVYSPKYQINVFDVEVMKNYIRAFYEKSIANGFNMFDKANFYIGLIDEPEENEIIDNAIIVMQLFNNTIKEVADELELVSSSHPMHNELINSIRNLQNIVTNKFNEELDPYVETWCPKVDEYHRQFDREKYDDQKEKWWYTCVYPRAPYPTYHTEDSLTSARLLSWMQADYDIAGNLYWATNNYAKMINGVFQPIEDVYAQADFAANINGDGYLFYPGGQYGLDEPVPSIRLEAIRDGLEEYEILYDLKNQVSDLSLDSNALINLLTYSLYSGTKVHGSNEDMRLIRDELLDFYVANKNGSDFAITNYENTYNGKVKLEFFANTGSEIKINGTKLSSISSLTGGDLYEYSCELNKSNNKINIEVTYEGITSNIVHNFGGETKVKEAEIMQNGFSKYNASVSATIVDGKDVSSEFDYNVLKMEIGAPKELKQSIKYIPSFLNEIDSSTSGFNLEVYNPSDENIEFSIGCRYEKRNTDTYLEQNQMLKPGLNRIFVSTSNINFSSLGKMKYLMFVFGNSDSTEELAKMMYFGRFSIMKK